MTVKWWYSIETDEEMNVGDHIHFEYKGVLLCGVVLGRLQETWYVLVSHATRRLENFKVVRNWQSDPPTEEDEIVAP